MDTDDLSKETYEAIIVEAERLTHDLTIHFGLISYECNNETEYIEKSEKLAGEIMQLDDYDLDDLFWGNVPEKDKLNFTLKKIISNIETVKKRWLKKEIMTKQEIKEKEEKLMNLPVASYGVSKHLPHEASLAASCGELTPNEIRNDRSILCSKIR